MTLTVAQQVAADAIRDEIIARLGTVPAGPLRVDAPTAVWVAGYVAAGPAVAEWMRRRGVPDDVVTATLSDVGGRTGLDAPSWPSAVLAGTFYQLGRLQFDLIFQQDEWVLDVHIPESGPLTPAAVSASFRPRCHVFRRVLPRPTGHRCGLRLLAAGSVSRRAPTADVQHRCVRAALHPGRRTAG